MRLIGGFQDTRLNGEDFAITPYLFGVWLNLTTENDPFPRIKIMGLGMCWGHYSVYLGLGWNIPKRFRTFKAETYPKK